MQNTPSRNARGVLRVATKENKNEKRQFKNTAERYKKQHRLATNKTVLINMNSKIYRTILLYRRKKFCATVLNAPNDLESQKGAERGYRCKSGLTCIGSGASCFLYGIKSGLVLGGWIIARVKHKGAKWGLWCVVRHIVNGRKSGQA